MDTYAVPVSWQEAFPHLKVDADTAYMSVNAKVEVDLRGFAEALRRPLSDAAGSSPEQAGFAQAAYRPQDMENPRTWVHLQFHDAPSGQRYPRENTSGRPWPEVGPSGPSRAWARGAMAAHGLSSSNWSFHNSCEGRLEQVGPCARNYAPAFSELGEREHSAVWSHSRGPNPLTDFSLVANQRPRSSGPICSTGESMWNRPGSFTPPR